jgi:hypothetical protein
MDIGLEQLFVCIKYRGPLEPHEGARKRSPFVVSHAAPCTGASYMKFTVAPDAQARTGTLTFWPIFSE